MIEEVTRQLVGASMMVIVLVAPPVTLLLSVLVLGRYRRAVLRAMDASAAQLPAAGRDEEAPLALPLPSPSAGASASPGRSEALLARLLREPRRTAARVLFAGVAYAVTMALAVVIAFEPMRTWPRFALALWGALWPVIPALALTAPAGLRTAALAVLVYLAPFGVIIAVGVLLPTAPPPVFGGEAAAIRAALSPPEIVRAWLVFNGAPTLLLVLFLNRWTRAAGPLTLAFVTSVLIICTVMFLALFARPGGRLLAALERATPLSADPVLVRSVFAGVALLAIMFGTLLGAVLLRRVRAGYLRKTLNTHSLTLDALWLVYAAFHGLFFAWSGIGWVAAAVLGLLACWVAGRLLAPIGPRVDMQSAHGLIFLRVFSLGRRSERLFDGLLRHWRHVGSVQLITGPDLAHSTVQPHQLLDFVSGRLASHFIADERSLARRVAGCDRKPDLDGLYRVNSLFCHADTWQAALKRLVSQGDTVLMDLRSFSKDNAGCLVELRHLVHRVPLARCVWVTSDDSDERAFLQCKLREVWQQMPPTSPNWGTDVRAAPLHVLAPGRRGLLLLIGRLAIAAEPVAEGSPNSTQKRKKER